MIEIIAGTNRPDSNASRVAALLLAEYQKLGAQARVLDLRDLPAAIFDPSSYAAKPASFQPFLDRVLAAEGLHVVVPEYNGSFPGVLKYFVDMLKFPESFERKPVAFVGEAAGLWGGFRAVEQLQMIFGYRNALTLPERVFLPAIQNKLTPDRDGWADAGSAKLVADQCALFAKWVKIVANGAGKTPATK
jgi:chromate reductase